MELPRPSDRVCNLKSIAHANGRFQATTADEAQAFACGSRLLRDFHARLFRNLPSVVPLVAALLASTGLALFFHPPKIEEARAQSEPEVAA